MPTAGYDTKRSFAIVPEIITGLALSSSYLEDIHRTWRKAQEAANAEPARD